MRSLKKTLIQATGWGESLGVRDWPSLQGDVEMKSWKGDAEITLSRPAYPFQEAFASKGMKSQIVRKIHRARAWMLLNRDFFA